MGRSPPSSYPCNPCNPWSVLRSVAVVLGAGLRSETYARLRTVTGWGPFGDFATRPGTPTRYIRRLTSTVRWTWRPPPAARRGLAQVFLGLFEVGFLLLAGLSSCAILAFNSAVVALASMAARKASSSGFGSRTNPIGTARTAGKPPGGPNAARTARTALGVIRPLAAHLRRRTAAEPARESRTRPGRRGRRGPGGVEDLVDAYGDDVSIRNRLSPRIVRGDGPTCAGASAPGRSCPGMALGPGGFRRSVNRQAAVPRAPNIADEMIVIVFI